MKIRKVLCITALLILCVFVYFACDDFKDETEGEHGTQIHEEPIQGDNVVTYSDVSGLVTQKYSTEQIEALKETIDSIGITYDEFETMFNVECQRDTYQGFYVVLSQEDNKRVFVFFDHDAYSFNPRYCAAGVMIVDEFKTKQDFETIIAEKACLSEVLSLDPNAIQGTNSGTVFTIHIVQDGILGLWYENSESPQDAVVDAGRVRFYENGAIPTLNDSVIRDYVPYILPIDKYEPNSLENK